MAFFRSSMATISILGNNALRQEKIQQSALFPKEIRRITNENLNSLFGHEALSKDSF